MLVIKLFICRGRQETLSGYLLPFHCTICFKLVRGTVNKNNSRNRNCQVAFCLLKLFGCGPPI